MGVRAWPQSEHEQRGHEETHGIQVSILMVLSLTCDLSTEGVWVHFGAW